jgi:hypothetical protein
MAEHQNPISRRRMLKRVGAGAAIAWSAPVLSSLRTPAFAQAGRYPPPCPEQCEGLCDAGVCGETLGLDCLCAETVDAGCACFQPICLQAPQVCDAANPVCPEGFACVIEPCCGISFCALLCGTVLPLEGGRRWA